MVRRPAGWPATLKALIPFAAGIWLADRVGSEAASVRGAPSAALVLLLVAAGGILLASAARFRWLKAGLPAGALILCAGFIRYGLPLTIPADPRLERAAARGDTLLVAGRAERVEMRRSGTWRVALEVAELAAGNRNLPAAGSVSLAWPDSLAPPGAGDWLKVRIVPRLVRGPTNPGEWDQRQALWRRGVRYQATLRTPRDLVESRPTSGLSPERALRGLRRAMAASIDRRLDGFPGRFARVLLIGDRVSFRPEEELDFRRAGVTHILSVSGLHVGLVAATVQLLLGRRRRLGGLATSSAAVWGYTLIVGAPSAAVRSAAMLTLVIAARHLRRALSGPALLSGALFLLLAAAPGLLFDLGFQLSALSVAGLLAAHGLLKDWPAVTAMPRPARIGVETLAMTLSAQAATATLTLPLWGDWPLVAPLANLLVVGLSDLVLTGGFLGLALDLVQRAAADRVFAAVWALSQVVGFGVHQLAAHSPGMSGLPPPPAGVPLFYAAAAAGGMAARSLAAPRRLVVGLALAWALGLGLLVAAPRSGPGGLRMTVLDVGQGDAILLEFPDGKAMLVDGGEGGLRDAGGRVVLPAVRGARLRRLDAVVMSHAHGDHLGGLSAVVAAIPVRRLYESGYAPAAGEAAGFRRLCFDRRVPPCIVAAGDTLLAGPGYSATVLWPPRAADPLESYERPDNGLNDLSLVLRVDWRGHRLVLPGDAGTRVEQALVAGGPAGRIDVLKVGHHGSRTSSSVAWIDWLSPRLATLSVGEKNRFRHPAPVVVDRYRARDVALHRTDRGGALRLTWERGGVRFERWGDGRRNGVKRGFVPDGGAWPRAFLDDG